MGIVFKESKSKTKKEKRRHFNFIFYYKRNLRIKFNLALIKGLAIQYCIINYTPPAVSGFKPMVGATITKNISTKPAMMLKMKKKLKIINKIIPYYFIK